MESIENINEGTYWNNTGMYEKQAAELQKLVPNSGPSKTVKGEIFRAAMKIYYDYYNNGFGNVWPEVATFLRTNVSLPEDVVEMLLMHAMGNVGDGLDATVEEMMNTVIEQIYEMPDKPNTTDMWDTPYTENAFEPEQDERDDWDDEDDEDEYDEAKETSEPALIETPVSELGQEARQQLASDIDNIAQEANILANALRHKKNKLYKEHWEEFNYLVLRLQKQAQVFNK